MPLPAKLITHSLSGMDALGKLFWDEDRLIRGISPAWADFYRGLLDSGAVDRFSKLGYLVETTKTDYSSDRYPLVVQHRVLPVVSYASEWCAAHFRDAAIMILDFEMELRSNSLTLWDLSPWNVLFDRSKPIWIDFTSIHPLVDPHGWRARDQFRRFFYNVLVLFEAGLPRVARRLSNDAVNGVQDHEVANLQKRSSDHKEGRPTTTLLGRITGRGLRRTISDDLPIAAATPEQEIKLLKSTIASMPLTSGSTQWKGYHDDYFPPFSPSERWTNKHKSMDEIFAATKPRSLLDIGSNRGWYSRLAASHGAEVVIAADTDDPSINDLFADVKGSDLPIYPLFLDARLPEPAYGAGDLFASAADRFRVDMVVALALIHHLVFTVFMTFEQIISTFSMFSKRWLVIEYINTQDVVVSHGLGWSEEFFPWYNEQNFREALETYFHIVGVYPSDWGGVPNKGGPDGPMDRKIFLCEKR